MSARCPCCGSEVSRPVVVSMDTNTVTTAVGSAHFPRALIEIVSILARKYPGMARRDELGLAVFGNRYWDLEPNNLNVHVSRSRRELAPLGVGIKSVWGLGYRLFMGGGA